MANQMRLKYQDFDGTGITTSIAVRAEAYSTQAAKLVTLKTAIEDCVVGRLARHDDIREVEDNGPGNAETPAAQEALVLILEVKDTVSGIIYREKVPMPNLTKAADGDGDQFWKIEGQGSNSLTVVNPLHDDFITLKDAYDAVGVSPEGNNTVLQRAYVEK